jgi:hypothetical protein
MTAMSSMTGVGSPCEMLKIRAPWAILPGNGVFSLTHSSSVCSGLKSPDSPAKAVMSALLISRAAERYSLPSRRSSRYVVIWCPGRSSAGRHRNRRPG